MKSSYIIAIVIAAVVVLLVGGFLINKSFSRSEAGSVDIGKEGGATVVDDFKGSTQYIDITATGLSGERLHIFRGDRVIWRNKDTKPHRIASNLHPNHDQYPEAGGCVNSKFDSCGPILPGEEWGFVFNFDGTWGFHDDNNLQNAGQILVTEKPSTPV